MRLLKAFQIDNPEVWNQNMTLLQELFPLWIQNMRSFCATVLTPLQEAKKASIGYSDISILSFPKWLQKTSRCPDLSKWSLVASGSSLTDTYKDLQDFPGPVIANATNLGFLLSKNIIPHAVCIVDKHPKLGKILSAFQRPLLDYRIALIATPFIDPSAFTPFYPALDQIFLAHGYVDLTDRHTCPNCGSSFTDPPTRPEAFYINAFFRILLPELTAYFLQAGSVGSTLPQIPTRLIIGGDILTTTDPYDIKAWQPAESLIPIPDLYLYGYDGSLHKTSGRCPLYTEPHTFTTEFEPSSPLGTHTPTGHVTEESQIIYKRTLMTWLFLSWIEPSLPKIPMYLIDPVNKSIYTELPNIPSWKAKKPTITTETIIDIYQAYLRTGHPTEEQALSTGMPLDFIPLKNQTENS